MSGFAPFGNFWNYYQFNKVDERLQYINIKDVLRAIAPKEGEQMSILDVGCNEGDLTIAVSQLLLDQATISPQNLHILGIDLDHQLIERAKQKSDFIDFQHDNFMVSPIPDDFLAQRGQSKVPKDI